MSSETVLVVAPFWPWPGHVGVYRVDRMLRWLAERGVRVVLARAGRTDGIEEREWGSLVRVADPLRFFPDAYGEVGASAARPPRRPRILRRAAALALAPDPSVLWSLRAARHRPLLERAAGAAWVLSSSPPESAHIGAARLARRLGARLAVDLRDGWLDEPPRPELRLRWRRAVEARMERGVLRRAERVFVTSRVWGEMLARRLPDVAPRTVVLTNAYPPSAAWPDDDAPETPSRRDECTLLYAGRFTSSRADRTMDGLLVPLAEGMRRSAVRGTVRIVGDLDATEHAAAARWRERLAALGWRLEVEGAVPRRELLRRCRGASGLLLCDPSPAVLPSKLFEYLPTRRPIFAASPADGALAAVLRRVPQGFVAGGDAAGDAERAARFLDACLRDDRPAEVPDEYSERALGRRFAEALGIPGGSDPGAAGSASRRVAAARP
ncbi:MAG TPA: glycosyltransferase [Gemmatimonadaceae bacterium]